MLDKLKNNFDEYNLKARVFPSLLLLAPVFLVIYYFIHRKTGLEILESIAGSSLAIIILLFLLSDIVRNLGKRLELKVFINELKFPTTAILLHNNSHFTLNKKKQIFAKIKKDFSINFVNELEDKKNEELVRQKIKEVVGLVRQKVKDGRLLLSYNIRYGFWRNLLGSSLLSCIFCAVNIVIFSLVFTYSVGLIISVILFFFYLILFIFKKSLLNYFGYQYAEQLFLEYLSI